MEFDYLIVCNSNLEFNLLSKINSSSALIVSTNLFYEYEKKLISTFFEKTEFVCFSEYFDDKSLSDIDLLVEGEIAGSSHYINDYQQSIIKKKNQLVYNELVKKYTWNNCLFIPGLGVSENFWSKYGKAIHQRKKSISGLKKFISKFNFCKSNLSGKGQLYFIECETKSYLFFHEPKRLNIKENYRNSFTIIDYYSKKQLHKIIRNVSSDTLLCSTIHMYRKEYSTFGKTIHIFLDGFHPSNYPFSYMGEYLNAVFIYKDFIGKKWIESLGLTSERRPEFINKEYLSEELTLNPIQSICLLMNHSGDWCALINRSDTDLLINEFVAIAKKFKNIKFVIRLHPTATHIDHEGKFAFKRVQKLVSSVNINNLSLSEQSLEKDLQTNDLFISEYSNTLLDVYKIGKLGIICNLTNRRSFMKDYEDCGFEYCHLKKNLEDQILYAVENTEDVCRKQSDAAKKYNSFII